MIADDTAADLVLAVRALAKADPALARMMGQIGPCTLEINRAQSLFDALSRAIVYQQLTGKAAATIHDRVCRLFSKTKKRFTPKDILRASDVQLREAGLSRAKAAALRDLAQKVMDRQVPTLSTIRKMDNDAIIASLITVRGIGRWTVEMLLMFRLGRIDVLPADDYGVRKGFAVTYGKKELPSRKQLELHGEKWKPWRSVASWYMWRVADLGPRREIKKRTTKKEGDS